MKRFFTLLLLVAFATAGVFAQFEKYFDFEEGMADTAWVLFANGGEADPVNDIKVVANPLQDLLNTSDSVIEFLVRPDAATYVGAYFDFHTNTDEIIVLEEGASVIGMMLNKDVISGTKIKLELSESGAENMEIAVENTVTGAWELLLYDFAEGIGNFFKRLTIMPDRPATRDYGTTLWIDNIGVPKEDNTSVKEYAGETMMIYPNPADFRTAVVFPGMYSITISDILGKKIRTITFAPRDSKVIEVGDLKTGLYVVTAETATGAYTVPFVKK
jgi:hypothetical protein